jgi:hypothetical protein
LASGQGQLGGAEGRSLAAGVLAVLGVVAMFAVSSALGVIFRVELSRYSTEGSLGGGFTSEDITAAFRPR